MRVCRGESQLKPNPWQTYDFRSTHPGLRRTRRRFGDEVEAVVMTSSRHAETAAGSRGSHHRARTTRGMTAKIAAWAVTGPSDVGEH